MIDRYTRPEMGHIFSLENKYAIWQEIEVLACEAQAELGKCGITKEEAAWIREHAAFNKAEVDEIEAVTNHDVIAFLTNMLLHRCRCARGRSQAQPLGALRYDQLRPGRHCPVLSACSGHGHHH